VFIVLIKPSKKAAELVGILLGDGSFYISGYNNELDIALNTRDINYKNYVKYLLQSITHSYIQEKYARSANCVHLRLLRKNLVSQLLKISLIKPGNKIKNKVTIPDWIWEKPTFIANCIKGLVDTDGSIYKLKPQWPNLFQLSFKSNDRELLKDARKAFIKLNFRPSKIFGNRIVITRQSDIDNYFKKIGTHNDRNLMMAKEFTMLYKP
jgi:intein/homing endonuclease